jgi:uncharacterized protein YycO
MVHAIAEGVCVIDILDFVKDADGFILLRPRYKSVEDLDAACEFAAARIGRPYDFAFDVTSDDAYYCHELTYSVLKEAGLGVAFHDTIYAEDLMCVCDVLYESSSDP